LRRISQDLGREGDAMNKGLSVRDFNRELDVRMKAIVSGLKVTIVAALDVGEILVKAKESLPHGQFGAWLEGKVEQYGVSRTTLHRWMNMHSNRSEFIFPKMGKLSEAYRLLERVRVAPSKDDEEEQEAGLSTSEQEEIVDVTQDDEEAEDPLSSDVIAREGIVSFKENVRAFTEVAKEAAPLLGGLERGSKEWKSCAESVRSLYRDVRSLGDALRNRTALRALSPQ
jgi:hypothetical protein